MDKKIITIIVLAAVLVVMGVFFFTQETPQIVSQVLSGRPIPPNSAFGTNTSSTITATTSVQLILAYADYAQLRIISNVGAADAWISSTSTSLTANTGFWLKASSSVIFSGDSLYTGNLYAIGTATTTLAIFQL